MTDLDIAYKLNAEIVTFWQFYVAGMSAVVGWVFSRSTSWSLSKRVGITVAIVVFMIFSISGLYRSTSALHDVIYLMLADGYAIPAGITPAIFDTVIARLNSGDWYMHIGPHLIVDAIIIYFVSVVSGQKPTGQTATRKIHNKRTSDS